MIINTTLILNIVIYCRFIYHTLTYNTSYKINTYGFYFTPIHQHFNSSSH